MNESLNIIIPVFNEDKNILTTLSLIQNKVKCFDKIFIVYDREEDTTLPVVRNYFQNLSPDKASQIVLVKNFYGKGVLNAIKTGFESVRSGVVLVTMADLSDDVSTINAMLEKVSEGYDLVCGSRYMKGGGQIGGPRFKSFLSRTAGVSLYYLTGIPTRDVTNSFKMYKKEILDAIQIESNGGFELGMEIVVKSFLKGFKITEVPTVWKDRESGQSNFKLWKWLPKYIHWYWFCFHKSLLCGRKNRKI